LGLLAGEQKGAIDLRVEGGVTPGLRKRAEQLLQHRVVAGVTLGVCRPGRPVWWRMRRFPNGARLRARPDTFAQANRSMVPLLSSARPRKPWAMPWRVLELFCGSGTLTLPLLEQHRQVTGVESASTSLALARRSADEAGLG